MEQHNIDSRFKKGLENMNRQPSPDAWARLQSQMNAPIAAPETEPEQPEEKKEERRILLWWHYAAAAVVLLFLSVGIFKNDMFLADKTAMPVAVNKPATQTETAEKAMKAEQPEEILSNEAPQIAATETPEINSETSVENKTKNDIKNEVKTTFAKASETQVAQTSPKVKTQKTIAEKPEKVQTGVEKIVQPEETLIASNHNHNAAKPEVTETKPALLAGMAIEVIVKKDNSENAVAVNNPAPETDKDSKLKSIFKQAKNLKNGESVDLQALGLTADSKLAMGTRKLTKVLDI